MALQRSAPDDVVLIAGKGHEDYQVSAHGRREFRDQTVVADELARLPCEPHAHPGGVRTRLWRSVAAAPTPLHGRGERLAHAPVRRKTGAVRVLGKLGFTVKQKLEK